jgi:hypothetical protein
MYEIKLIKKGKVITLHATKAYGGIEVEIHSITSELIGVK